MILVEAPANDTNPALTQMAPQFVRDYVKYVGPTHRRCKKKKKTRWKAAVVFTA